MFITAKIDFIFTSLTAVQIYDFHIFTTVYSPLHGFIWNQHTDLLSVGLLAQLVARALHRYRRGHEFKSCSGLNFFQAFFLLLLSSVHYCEDRFHIQEMLLFAHLEKQLHGKDPLKIRPTQRSVIARQQNMTFDGGRREETELSHLTRETKNRISK